MNVVLVEPRIPQNTGNIARTCAVTGSSLHLVKPLGFSLKDKYLKRAGLDYWDDLDIHIHESFDDFLKKHQDDKLYLFSTKAAKTYTEEKFTGDEYLIFGKETAGLPEDFIKDNLPSSLRIPMRDYARSLNLANSVAIVLYEAYRQLDFPGFQKRGKFMQEF
ncbi:MAG: tRNA (uridine(34)/cytosine(34)/5-carboxymethylaminomethyluridine(34)-2'-O)-methyltransferase TrmL [Halarsenatibacteraceae bacterium]